MNRQRNFYDAPNKVTLRRATLFLLVMLLTSLFVVDNTAYAVTATYRTITGNPFTINVGDDSSYQLFLSGVSGGNFYNPSNNVGDTGLFIVSGNTVFGQDSPSANFNNILTSYTNRTVNAPTGTGTAADPFRIVVTFDAAGVTRVTETVSYVNGSSAASFDYQFAPLGGTPAMTRVFFAADIYFSGSDSGLGYFNPETGAVGGYKQDRSQYILFRPVTPTRANAFFEGFFSDVWDRIGTTGTPGPGFNNTIDGINVHDDGAGLQYNNFSTSGRLTINLEVGNTPPNYTNLYLLSSAVRVGSTLGTNPPNSRLVSVGTTPANPPASSSTTLSVSSILEYSFFPVIGVVGVVTNVACTAGGNLRFWATGRPIPATVNLNVPGANPNLNISTSFYSAVDSSGRFNIGLGSGAGVSCGYAVDVTGFIVNLGLPEGVTLLSSPVRLKSSIATDPNPAARLVSGGENPQNPPNASSVSIQATGVGGIPANATGILGVVTNVQCTAGGNFRFWAGTTVPSSNNLNIPGASYQLNLSTSFIAPLDATGKLNLGYGNRVPGSSCGFAVDAIGYSVNGAVVQGISNLPSSVRVASSIATDPNPLPRLTATGPNPPNPPSASSVQIQVGGTGGIPADAVAVVGVVTNVQCTAGGNLRFWTPGQAVPASVSLNVPGSNPALNISTGFAAKLSNGKLNLGFGSGVANASCGFAVDIVGYTRG